jgi:maleate isomerase
VTDDRVLSIGVLTPHAAAGAEVELPDMAPRRVVTRVARVEAPGGDPHTPGEPPTSPSGLLALTVPSALDDAAATFGGGSVDAIGYASTSTGYALGSDAEAVMLRCLSQRWGLPVAGTSLAAGAALRALRVRRVALVHPPWFSDELNHPGAACFGGQGFEVVSSESAGLPNDPAHIEPGAVVEWISRHLGDEAEAVFIGGTGFRAARAIEVLEARAGRPVLESNQVLLWSILSRRETDIEVTGYGRLFGQR